MSIPNKKIIICAECGDETYHFTREFCRRCYNKYFRSKSNAEKKMYINENGTVRWYKNPPNKLWEPYE